MDHGTVPHHDTTPHDGKEEHGTVPHQEEDHGASLMEHHGQETTSHGVPGETHEEWGSSSSLTEEFPISQ